MITGLTALHQQVFLNGRPFGKRGNYVQITGVAEGKIDPNHPANRSIPTLEFAPRDESGLISYRTSFKVLRPAIATLGNKCLLFEAPNRGKSLIFQYFFGANKQDNALDSDELLGDAQPFQMGFTLAWCGWDISALPSSGLMIETPEACGGDGSPVGIVREEFVAGTRPGSVEPFRLTHQAATLDQSQARLSVRRSRHDAPLLLSNSDWQYLDARRVALMPEGAKPTPGWLYEFRYPATHSPIAALGYAATRDFVSCLKNHTFAADLTGEYFEHALAVGISQAGRYLRGFVGKGFNRDENDRRVFDGVFTHVAGAGTAFVDQLFAQPFRTRTQHQDHAYPEHAFPFYSADCEDPQSGRAGAMLTDPGCDPFLIETNTSAEYWQKGASLLHTDPLGKVDLELPANSRIYLIAGTQHDARAGLTSERGVLANPSNPHDPSPVLRALFHALYKWVSEGVEPPSNCVPRIRDGSLVTRSKFAFPEWKGVVPPPDCNDIAPPSNWVDPAEPGFPYVPLVPAVDMDGNEIAGVRTPDIQAPIGTYTGWNRYRAPYPEEVLGDRYGSFLPFAPTRTEGLMTGDPRPSLGDRYGCRAAYVSEVSRAAQSLLTQRLLLPADAQAYVFRAEQGIGVTPAQNQA